MAALRAGERSRRPGQHCGGAGRGPFCSAPDFGKREIFWLLCKLVVFVLNAAGRFFSLARFATTGDVVHGEEDRARAVGLAEATTSAAGIRHWSPSSG